MDSSGRLLSVHIRFPGIRGNDRRVLSRRVVDEMLAAFRELSRDAGRESNRRADAQAAEMDSSGRLLGVHIRFLGIRGNAGCRIGRGTASNQLTSNPSILATLPHPGMRTRASNMSAMCITLGSNSINRLSWGTIHL